MPEFPCDGPIDANIHIASGSVHVIAEDRSTVHVSVEPKHLNEAGRAAAGAARIDFTGNTLTIDAQPRTIGFIRIGHSLKVSVRVPLDSRVEVKAASANVAMTGRYGACVVHTASGDARVDDVVGNLSVNSASGDWEIGTVSGDVAIHTASGDVRVKTIGGNLALRSASGDADVDALGGSLEANTASGNVSVGSIHAGTANVNSASGDVKVGVAEGTAVWLDINTVSGNTRSDLAVSDSPPEGNPATLKLHIRTISGDVLIRRAAPITA
jgi:DUF4097 and DUF4098 domain-containing protein YvlB